MQVFKQRLKECGRLISKTSAFTIISGLCHATFVPLHLWINFVNCIYFMYAKNKHFLINKLLLVLSFGSSFFWSSIVSFNTTSSWSSLFNYWNFCFFLCLSLVPSPFLQFLLLCSFYLLVLSLFLLVLHLILLFYYSFLLGRVVFLFSNFFFQFSGPSFSSAIILGPFLSRSLRSFSSCFTFSFYLLLLFHFTLLFSLFSFSLAFLQIYLIVGIFSCSFLDLIWYGHLIFYALSVQIFLSEIIW